MSFREAPKQKTALQSDNFRNFVLPIIFFGGFAFVIWSFSHFLWRTAEEGAQTVRIDAPPAPSGPPEAGKFEPPVFAPLDHRPKAGEDEGTGIISIMPTPVKKAKAVAEWRMRGVIYDLITFKPVPGVSMIFTDNQTNARAQILTDAKGRYRVLLPPLPGHGYLITLAKSGYETSYLSSHLDGIREMSLERRREIGRELASEIGRPTALKPHSEAPLLTDFYLAPK
jgi:hypothetical protein